MKKFLVLFAVIIAVLSCDKKDVDNSSDYSIVGTWKFKEITAKVETNKPHVSKVIENVLVNPPGFSLDKLVDYRLIFNKDNTYEVIININNEIDNVKGEYSLVEGMLTLKKYFKDNDDVANIIIDRGGQRLSVGIDFSGELLSMIKDEEESELFSKEDLNGLKIVKAIQSIVFEKQ